MDEGARLDAARVSKPSQRLLQCRLVERVRRRIRLALRAEVCREVRRREVFRHRRRVVVRRRVEEGFELLDELGQPPRARSQQRQHARPPVCFVRCRIGAEKRLQSVHELGVGQPQQVLMVEPVELLGVEHGVAAADAVEREGRDELVTGEQLPVALARRPAEQRQEVHHRVRQIAERRVLRDGRGAVALAQPLLVGPHDERHVRKRRRGRAERLVEQHLLRRVRDVVVAAHHVRDPHVDVVNHH